MSTRPAPVDFQSWMRSTERRLTGSERRPPPSAALLGPGIGPTATEISDWNSDVIAYNGFFFSQPGAINSPDPTKAWMGYSIADPDGIGYQVITIYRDPASEGSALLFPNWPAPTYSRAFYSEDGMSRAYSPWAVTGAKGTWQTQGSGGDQTVTGTSFNLLANLFIDLPVTTSAQVFWINAIIDVQHTDTGNQLFTTRVTVAGNALGTVLRFNAQAINNLRQTLSGRWRVTGLTPGTRRAQLEASLSAGGNYNVNINNCLISAEIAS